MVTDEERDYMYAEYAKDPLMKRNVGISRRLFPLLENDRNVVELFHAMLFSMPGSPVLYYGDEIGMGDNIYLGDRDGVRTPMQWTPDRNGGFSRADFAQLYLPPLMDPVYGFQATNVEAEQRDPSSFLHWMRRMLEVRKQHPVLGMGTFEVLEVENPSVLAYLRRGLDLDEDGQEDIVLCVHNLSRFAQPAELQLGALAGKQPIELMGRVPFPLVGELPVLRHPARPRLLLVLPARRPRTSDEHTMTLDAQLAGLLPDFLARQRWFAGDAAPASVDGRRQRGARRRAARPGVAAGRRSRATTPPTRCRSGSGRSTSSRRGSRARGGRSSATSTGPTTCRCSPTTP